MSIQASIVGATGYTGFELIRILSSHPNVKISSIVSRQNENVNIQNLYPSLNVIEKLSFQKLDIEKITSYSDIVFTALPHKASMKICAELIEKNVKVIDLSADFRFENTDIYEQWYCEHTYQKLNKDAVYGLPEIYREQIKNSHLVANPGCYPTSIILALYPLLNEKVKISEKIIADSKSGVTGAGRNPSLKTLFTEVNDNFSAYSVGKHRHEPEITERCSLIYNKELDITFTPHLLPINRGILSTIYVDIKDKNLDFSDIYNLYKKYYGNEFFIKLLPMGETPSTAMVKASNYCFIGLSYIKEKNRLILVSVIDNIVKGASGQAVQNMNIMFDLPEHTGLTHIPTYL